MSLLVFFFEVFYLNIGITLGRREGRMTQKFLNGTQVGSLSQKVSSKRVAQSMGRQIVRKAQHQPHLFKIPLNNPRV